MYGEMTAFCCESDTAVRDALYGHNVELLNVNQPVLLITTILERVVKLFPRWFLFPVMSIPVCLFLSRISYYTYYYSNIINDFDVLYWMCRHVPFPVWKMREPKTCYARVKIMDRGTSAAEFWGHVCCVYFQWNPSALLKQSLVICPRLLNVNATVINWSQIKHTAPEFKFSPSRIPFMALRAYYHKIMWCDT